MFKIKRKTIYGNFYNEKQGTFKIPITKIKLMLFGFIPVKTFYQYGKSYNGLVLELDKDGNPIYTSKTRQKFLKVKIKHEKMRNFVIKNLKKISKEADSEEVKKLADSTLKQLMKNKDYLLE